MADLVKPMTVLPSSDAPIGEWCRPLSATMINYRMPTSNSSVVPGQSKANGRQGNGRITMKKIRARMAAKGSKPTGGAN
jgi:hypothetical protein